MTGQANGILESLTGRSKDLDRIQYSYDLGNGQFGIDTVIDDKPDMDESQMSLWIPYADGRHRDGVGDLLEVGGINCDRHRANSLILYDHAKTQSLPIAKARDRVTDEYTNVIDPVTKIAKVNAFFYDGKGLANTDRTKEYDHAVFCEQLYDMATQGFVKGGSLGYQVIAARELPPDYEKGTPKGLHLLNVLMLEASLVVLPANADTVRKCLCQDKMCGKPLSPILVKSLAPFASPKKAMMGWEDRQGSVKSDLEDTQGRLTLPDKWEVERERISGKWFVVGPNDEVGPSFNSREEAKREADKRNGTEGKKDVSLPEGNLSETNVPPVEWKPGLGATKGTSMNGKDCSCGSCEKCKSLPEELIDTEEKAFSSISRKFLGKDFPPLAPGTYDSLAHKLASQYGGSPAAIAELTKLEAEPGRSQHERRVFAKIREIIERTGIKSQPRNKALRDKYRKKGWDWASWKRAFTDALGMFTDDRTWSEGDVLELYEEGVDPKEAAQRLGKSLRTKSLNPIRKKYRSSKGIVHRIRKSSAGSGMVHIDGKDLEAAQQLAESKGVKFTRVSSLGSLEKVKLMGDDNGIDEVAKQFGRRKSLPYRKKSGLEVIGGIIIGYLAYRGAISIASPYVENIIEYLDNLGYSQDESHQAIQHLEQSGKIAVTPDGKVQKKSLSRNKQKAWLYDDNFKVGQQVFSSEDHAHGTIVGEGPKANTWNVWLDNGQQVTRGIRQLEYKRLSRQRQKGVRQFIGNAIDAVSDYYDRVSGMYDDNEFYDETATMVREGKEEDRKLRSTPKQGGGTCKQGERADETGCTPAKSLPRVSTKNMVIAPVVDNGGFAITDATTIRNGWVEKNDVDWAIFPTRLEAEQELEIVQGLVPTARKSFARFVRLKDIHPDPNIAKIFKQLLYGMLTNQQASAELVASGMSQEQAQAEIASLDADMRPPTRNKAWKISQESDGFWIRGQNEQQEDLGPFETWGEARQNLDMTDAETMGRTGYYYGRKGKKSLPRQKQKSALGALAMGLLTGYVATHIAFDINRVIEFLIGEGVDKDTAEEVIEEAEQSGKIDVTPDGKVKKKSLPRHNKKGWFGPDVKFPEGTMVRIKPNARERLRREGFGDKLENVMMGRVTSSGEDSGWWAVTWGPDPIEDWSNFRENEIENKFLPQRKVKDLAIPAGPGGIDGTVQTLNSAGITEFLVQGSTVLVPDNPSNRSSLQQMQIPFQAKSLPRQRVKDMNGDIYADESLPKEEEMKDLNGEVQTPEMPYSAQVAQRILADHKTLLKDYDEFNGPQLEHEPTRKLLTKLLEQKAANLDEWEGHVQKHHPDFADSIVGKDLDADEENDTQEGLKDVEDDIDEVADDLDADFDSTEEEKDLPSENDATPASSAPEDEPTPEEALEGMSVDQAKSLARRRQKAFRIARQKSLQQRNGRVRRKDFPDEIETTEEQAVIDDPTPIEQDPGMKALASHEKAQVAQAADFADELSQTDNLDQEKRFKSYHMHKTLEELSGDSPLDHDTKSEIGSPEWEAEEGMEPEHKRFRKDHSGAMVESAADVPQAMIDAEAVKPPVTKSLHPHRKMCKDASGFFGDIAHTQDFGIPHKEQAKALAKALGDVASSPDEVEMPGEPEMVGNLGEMGQKAFKVGDRVVETAGEDPNEVGEIVDVDESGDWFGIKWPDGLVSDLSASEIQLKSLRRRVKAGWHKSAEDEEEDKKNGNGKRLPRRIVRRKSVEDDEKKKKEEEKAIRLKKAFEDQNRTIDEMQKKLALVAAKLN